MNVYHRSREVFHTKQEVCFLLLVGCKGWQAQIALCASHDALSSVTI